LNFFFLLIRSKRPVFTVAEWAAMYQNAVLVQSQRQQGNQEQDILCQQRKQKITGVEIYYLQK
jgi:hypothetical protein